MKLAIVKYNAGNVQSVLFALERIGVNAILTDEPEVLKSADKVIFPGVGEAGSAMHYLRDKKLDVVIKELKQPVLGICLGMQLLCKYSEESNTTCLGLFDIAVKKFSNDKINKVPQVGWNNIFNLCSPLFRNVNENDFVYFVHSYYAELTTDAIATCNYGLNYGAALHKNNFYATQFHPEKSGRVGEQIVENFIKLI